MADFVRAVATADIPDGHGRLWRHGEKRIALFRTPAGVYAADNRCPHEGYALKDGDIRGDVLTCAWHNWKFRITDGRCLFGGENIRTYPTSVREGWVYVDVTDPAPEEIAPELFASLLAAMGDVDTGRLARDTMRLNAIGMPLTEVVRTGVTYGATRAEYGWNHSLATLADCLTMAAAFEGPLSTLPVIQGLATVSRTEVRRPPRRGAGSSPGGEAQELFSQRFLGSVPGYEGEFYDVGAIGEGAVRGRWLDLAHAHVGCEGDAEAGRRHGQLGEDRVGEVADIGAESSPAAGRHQLVVIVR